MRKILLSVIVWIVILLPTGAVLGQPPISSEIAKLRVAMNATTVLLTRTSDGKIVGGVALEVGEFIAKKLGVP